MFTLYLNDLAHTVFLKHFDILYSNLHCRGRFRHFLNRGKIKTFWAKIHVLRIFFKLYLLYDFLAYPYVIRFECGQSLASRIFYRVTFPFQNRFDKTKKSHLRVFFTKTQIYVLELYCIVSYVC